MPEIKCDYGHKQSIGTDEWLATLTMDQLRYARDQAEQKIKAAEDLPKRVIWRVCCGGLALGNYPESQYEQAADHLIRIYKESFVEEAVEYVRKPYGTETFRRSLPSMEIALVTQFEYDTEWFPST